MRINKKYITNDIIEYIIKILNDNDIVEYKNILSYMQNNDSFKQFINNKKNPIVYINNFIKYNRQILNKLLSHNIVRNGNGFVYSQQLENIIKPTQCTDIIINNTDIFDKFSCPYITTIKNMRSSNKISAKLSLTNERVLNYKFYNDEIFCHVHNIFSIPHTIISIDNTVIAYLNDIQIAKITFLDKYINIEYNLDITTILKKCKIKYPFSHFEFFYISAFMFILFKSDAGDISKYCFTKIFDILTNKVTVKYFIESTANNTNITSDVFDMFFKEKINSIVLDEYLLIKEIYNCYTVDTTFQEFVISCYKLIVYFKNKINREVKNIALELYDKNRVVVINKFININDPINSNGDATYADIISNETDNIFYI